MLAGFIAYFVAGAIILNKKYEKTGADMIPQRVFWFALPGLVKVTLCLPFCLFFIMHWCIINTKFHVYKLINNVST